MVTIDEYKALLLQEKKGRSKYGNEMVKCPDWGLFHSKGEYGRWNELLIMQRAGEISNLQRQVAYEFPIVTDTGRNVEYVADFVYTRKGESYETIEDFKGAYTENYLIKKSLMRYFFGIEIFETRRKEKNEPKKYNHKYGRKKE